MSMSGYLRIARHTAGVDDSSSEPWQSLAIVPLASVPPDKTLSGTVTRSLTRSKQSSSVAISSGVYVWSMPVIKKKACCACFISSSSKTTRYPDRLTTDRKGAVWEHQEASSNHFLLSQQASCFQLCSQLLPVARLRSSARRRHDMTLRMIMGGLGSALDMQPIG